MAHNRPNPFAFETDLLVGSEYGPDGVSVSPARVKEVESSFAPQPVEADSEPALPTNRVEPAPQNSIEKLDTFGRAAKLIGKTPLGSRLGRGDDKLGMRAGNVSSKVVETAPAAIAGRAEKRAARSTSS